MTLNLELDGEQAQRLAAYAERLQVPVAELVKAAISELIIKAESDFEQAARRVLDKNAELYQRLAQ